MPTLGLIEGNETTVLRMTQALYGVAPGYSYFNYFMTNVQANGASGFAGALTNAFSSVSDSSLATTVLANLGLTTAGGAALQDALTTLFATYGTAARGQIILNLANLLAAKTGDATYGAAADAFNAQISNAYTYSTVAANTTPTSVSAATGQTLTLTTATNALTGGTGDDTFEASLAGTAGTSNTLTALDNLDGGAGTDTLIAEIRQGVTPANLANIEVVNANFSAAVTLGLSNAAQLTTVVNQGSTFAAVFSGLGATVTNLSVADVATDTEFVFASTTGSQTVALEVAAVTAAAEIEIDGIETLNITASGAAVYDVAADAATTLSFAGSSNQTVTLDATTLSVSKFDGSTATGNITLTTTDQTAVTASTDVTVSGGAGNDTLTLTESNDMSVSGGAGNDLIVMAAIDLNDTVNGGDGTDTLSTVMAQANVLDAATPTTYTVSGIEALRITDAFDGTLVTSNIDTAITTVNLAFASAAGSLMAGGDTITGPASALTVNLGGSAAGNTNVLTGSLTVGDTGTATTDSVALNNTAINSTTGLNLDVFGGQAVTSSGYENVTLSTGAVAGGAEQSISTLTITPDSVSAGVSLTVTGTNALDINTSLTTTSTGLMTVNASGMTAQAAGTTTFDINSTSQGTGGTASITGSEGEDIIVVGNFASTIVGGAGIDALTGGTAADSISGGAGNDIIAGTGGNDTLLGGDGDDQITDVTGGSVSIDGGAGNDTVVTTNALLTSGDTLVGGDGTDILSTSTAITTGTTAARVSGFETLRFSATGQSQNMANFVNNTFTRIDNMGAALTVTNAGSAVATLGLDVPGGTTDFSRLVDSSADVLTVVAITDAIDADNATVLTVDNEETLTFNVADGNLQLRTLNAADVTSLTVTGDNDFIIETAIVGATALATINASGVTGTEAVTINASASTVALTFTGGTTTGTTTLTTGSGADVVTAGSAVAVLNATTGVGNDSITGNAGADIIDGGSGVDTITGGEGIDSITGGAGSDVIVLTETTAVSDEVVLSSTGTDSVTGFATGAGGDQFDVAIGALEAAFNVNLTLLDANSDIAAATASLVQEVTADAAANAGATMFVLRGTTFDTTSDVENALETGDFEIGHTAFASGDGFLVAYSDGTDAYIALVRDNVATSTTDFTAGELTVTNLAKLVGNSSLAASELVSANFDFIA